MGKYNSAADYPEVCRVQGEVRLLKRIQSDQFKELMKKESRKNAEPDSEAS